MSQKLSATPCATYHDTPAYSLPGSPRHSLWPDGVATPTKAHHKRASTIYCSSRKGDRISFTYSILTAEDFRPTDDTTMMVGLSMLSSQGDARPPNHEKVLIPPEGQKHRLPTANRDFGQAMMNSG